MKLGAFSISLSVQDLLKSREFYTKLGFKVIGGKEEMNYLILQNENSTIGIFQGMFENNILTFNPGWNQQAQKLDEFEDVRTIQQAIKAHGIDLITEADENTSGPASIILTDPDGNQILIDQHV